MECTFTYLHKLARPLNWLVFLFLCLLTLPQAHAGTVSGERIQWYPLTFDFNGPSTSESSESPNPFLDFRLTLELTSPSGQTRRVPGFYAGDGNGGSEGNVWRVRFSPEEAGNWRYRAEFRQGNEIAVSLDANTGTATAFDGESGELWIAGVNPAAPGFQKWGSLDYTGEHYLKFRNGPYWIKTGTDSPENFLAYAGFDNTTSHGGGQHDFVHHYQPHVQDWNDDDPWFASRDSGIDSRGIIGALNYLSEQQINSIYFLPMNLGGDGFDTHPFLQAEKSRYHKTHFDLSKLRQWNTVLLHAQQKGIALNIVLNETELENREWQDNGQFGVERKLYYREMMARFGYLLAAKWNICEENNFSIPFVREAAHYLNALDWTAKPVSLHTQVDRFDNYEQLLGNPLITASSIQYTVDRAGEFVETWRARTRESGVPWVIDMDENETGLFDNNAEDLRRRVLYDVLFSGGNIEWYFGFTGLPLGGDITAENLRTREDMWAYSRHARNFMESHLPFNRMEPMDNLVSGENGDFGGAEVFGSYAEIYAVYFPNSSASASIDLPQHIAAWELRWFNPENGKFEGETQTLQEGRQNVGTPPSRHSSDWVVLIRSVESTTDHSDNSGSSDNDSSSVQPANQPSIETITPQTIQTGQTVNIVVKPLVVDGQVPGMYLENAPEGATFNDNQDGTRTFSWTPASNVSGITEVTVIVQIANIRIENRFLVNVEQQLLPPPPAVPQNTNSFPTVDLPQQIRTQPGTLLELLIHPKDADGSVPGVYLENMPAGASFNDNYNGSRTLSWWPDETAIGTHQIDVVIQDATNPQWTTRISLDVVIAF